MRAGIRRGTDRWNGGDGLGKDSVLYVFDVTTSETLWSRPVKGRQYGLQFSPADDLLAACGGRINVNLFNAESGSPHGRWGTKRVNFEFLSFSRDGRYLLTGAAQLPIQVWDLNKIPSTSASVPLLARPTASLPNELSTTANRSESAWR